MTEDERTREQGNGTEVLDHPSSFGPNIPVLQGIVLPWGKAFLSASDLQILHAAGLVSQIAAICDLEDTAGSIKAWEQRQRAPLVLYTTAVMYSNCAGIVAKRVDCSGIVRIA